MRTATRRKRWLWLALPAGWLALVALVHGQSAPLDRKLEVVSPAGLQFVPLQNSVTLRADTLDRSLRDVTVRQRYSAPVLRQNPVLTLGELRVDTTPVFANPASLSNVAASLQKQPGLAKVTGQRMEVFRINQGLVIHQFLSYQIRPGACSNASSRAGLQQLRLSCVTAVSDGELRSAFSEPGNVRFVADPRIRQQRLAEAMEMREQGRIQLARDLKELRSGFDDPVRRTQMVRMLGSEAELARLEQLDDEQLGAEMANQAQVEMEEVMFVPESGAVPAGADGQPSRQRLPPDQPAPAARQQVPEHVYLTGFTLGDQYEWSKKISITISWCIVGCEETYYIRPYVGFGYGFGLRLPITLEGEWSHESGTMASFVPRIDTVNANLEQFRETGIAHGKEFNAKELVAEVGVAAGLGVKVPGFGSKNVGFDQTFDFTEHLPGKFKNGQFKPPAPGSELSERVVFDQVDLLGGVGNLGVVGAKVLPELRFSLTSNQLEFRLVDHVDKDKATSIRDGIRYPVAVDPLNGTSRFSLGDPVYNLQFAMMPGIVPRVFVDVLVWSHHWDWDIWFPQLGIKLPPGGVDFACHAGTICTREYVFSAAGASESVGRQKADSESLWVEKMDAWRTGEFEPRWLKACPSPEAQGARPGAKGMCQVLVAGFGNSAVGQMMQLADEAAESKYRNPQRRDLIEQGLATSFGLLQSQAEVSALEAVNTANARLPPPPAPPPKLKTAPPASPPRT